MTAQPPTTIPTRDQVNPTDTWNLAKLYTSTEAWEADFEALQARLPELAAFEGKLSEGPETLRALLDIDIEVDRLLGKLYTYAARKSDEDTANSTHLGRKQRMLSLYTAYAESISYVSSELVSLPQETLDAYLTSDVLAPHRFNVEKIVRQKPHTLSAAEERLLAMAGEITRAPSQIFDQLNDADLDLGTLEDENGQQVELTHGAYRTFLAKPQRDVRKRFFHAFYGSYSQHRYTLAATLTSGVRANVFRAKARKHSSARAAALFGNNIPEAVYDNLLDTVHENLGGLHRYYSLHQRLLGLDDIHFYDVMAPTLPKVTMRFSYDEAVQLLHDALAPLGEAYVNTLVEGLRGGWVDRYENKNKASGAYSSGCYDSDPYILMNYRSELDDVFTLAHEAGHSMHTWHSKRQPPQYADYSIFVAEVASTFNECLLNHHLLQITNDPQQRAYLIQREIDDIRSTFFRQTMFAEFEHRLHQRVEAGKPMSLDDITGLYHEILEAYFGPDFTLDPELDLECLRIPHFYYNFYVYQYATGIAASLTLAQRVLAGESGALKAYIGFLSGGSSRFPIDLLREAGVDMASPEPVRAACAYFKQRVEELEGLMKEL